MRKALILPAVALVGLALATVAGASSAHRAAAPAAGCATAGLPVTTKGLLTIGTDNPAYPPWFGGGERKGSKWKINDPSTGKGYESAVAYEVARRLGFTRAQVKWQVVPFSRSFAPGKKSFDLFINQVSYAPERAKNVDFSSSYYDVAQAIVALKGKPIARARSVAGLRAFKLGAPIGTTSYRSIVDVVKPSGRPSVYDTLNDGVTALKNGQIDGLVVDLPTAFYITAAQIDNGTIVGQLPALGGTQEYFGLVLAKGSPLTSCVTRAVEAMRADGTLKRFVNAWLARPAGAPILK